MLHDALPKPEKPNDTFAVVGVSCAVSELNELKELLASMRQSQGFSCIVCLHPGSNPPNDLSTWLAADAAFTITPFANNTKLDKDRIYLLPPQTTLNLAGGVFQLTDTTEKTQSVVLDQFFSAIAQAYQNDAVAVALSPMLNDGVVGLKEIKAYGGLVLAMKRNAPNTLVAGPSDLGNLVDFMLPVARIPAHIKTSANPFEIKPKDADVTNRFANEDEDFLRQILALLRVKKNVDFTYYKQTTVKRRIVRRMALKKIETPAAYFHLLLHNKAELEALYSDMLISVTGFFRDPKSFDLLCEEVMPEIIDRKQPTDTLRIWVAGCATGEEAYTIAMCVGDYLAEKAPHLKLQIFATDISEKAIIKARSGTYEKADLHGLHDDQIEKYFIKTDGRYQVKKSIREHCVFALHNLLKDPPFARMDLISCRNVLIYMDPILQKKAFKTFNYALNANGVLMLGKSETPGAQAVGLFTRIRNHEKLFSKNTKTEQDRQWKIPDSESVFVQQSKKAQQGKDMADFQKSADDMVLARFAPPGVIVNDQFEIVQFRGSTGRWLEPSPGKASFNLLKMAKEGLSFELRNLLHKARQTNEPVRKENIVIVANGVQNAVTIEATQLHNTPEPYYLVLFQAATTNPGTEAKTTPQHDDQDLRGLHLKQLERELAMAREDMRSITEEQEAANEELQSANEELLSSSEELRSLNEELETSQEELQSANEELNMLNHELQDKNEQLSNTHTYLNAILDTIHDPVLILDTTLRVRSATKGFYSKFKTTEAATEGILFHELKSCPWNSPELKDKLERLVINGFSFEDFELTATFPAIGKRTLLCNARSLDRVNDEQLIIVSLEDVTLIRQEQQEMKASHRRLQERVQLAVEATGMGTWDFDPVTEVFLSDNQCKRIFGFGVDEKVDYYSFRNLIQADDRPIRDKALQQALSGDNNGNYDITYRIRVHGEWRWVRSKGRAFFSDEGKPVRIVGTVLDVTAQKTSEQLLKESEERFRLASDAATAMIWMSGKDNTRSYFNKSWLKFTGRSTEEEASNGWMENMHPDDVKNWMDTYAERFKQQKESYVEYRLRRNDGAYRWISDAAAPRFSADGEFVGFVGICLDIQEQKMTTDELERLVAERTQSLKSAVSELETSNQNLEEFAYVASHDLQEPLRKIQTFASFLEQTSDEHLNNDTKLYLSKIKDASQRMGQLIDDILSYSRLKSAEEALVDTNLSNVVQQVISDFDLKASEKKAKITYDKLPTVRAIPTRMNQVFQNLISNALKFSRKGVAPEIHITATLLTNAEARKYPSLNPHLQYARITLTDNGIGFDQEFAEKIFVIFQRLNGRSEYEGTGIGLAICRKIVMNHQGIIFANSTPGEGAVFTIILPVANGA